MTSNIKVVDVNEEAKQDIQEVKTEEVPQVVEEVKDEVANEVINEPVIAQDTEKKVEEVPKPEATPKPETLQDKVRCPKCLREMTIKAFKYRHEKACQGKLSEKAVKPHTKPKAKPKPKPEPITEEDPPPKPSEINPPMSEKSPTALLKSPTVPVKPPTLNEASRAFATVPATNPLMSHYQLLQQQYMQQKQERFNNLFQGMVGGSRKKR